MNELVQISPISPLRQRLLDDMAMRRFGPETQRNYLRDVSRFATWLQHSPHTATAEDIRQFQFEQLEAGVPAPTMNSIVSALRFLFTHTLGRPDLARKLIRTKQVRKIPVVLTMAEVKRLLDATRSLKHQAALSVAYGAGLRVAEMAALKISDVDSKRMLLRIERGKGGRYRNTMLPEAQPQSPRIVRLRRHGGCHPQHAVWFRHMGFGSHRCGQRYHEKKDRRQRKRARQRPTRIDCLPPGGASIFLHLPPPSRSYKSIDRPVMRFSGNMVRSRPESLSLRKRGVMPTYPASCGARICDRRRAMRTGRPCHKSMPVCAIGFAC